MNALGRWAAWMMLLAVNLAQAQLHEHSTHAPQDARAPPSESERAHVPPDPPSLQMGEMSKQRMLELMQMEDEAGLAMMLFDELEWRESENAFAWDAHAWYGNDHHKLWLKTEGERVQGATQARAELLWNRIVSRWWNMQAGVRHDIGPGPARTWAAVGVHGVAPYFVELAAAVYLGEQGRTALRLEAEYDLLLTQRLILRPRLELSLFGKEDQANGIGSGFSEVEFGLRLRYEIRREIAPYIGVHWQRKLGATGDIARAAGHDDNEIEAVAGIRAWF